MDSPRDLVRKALTFETPDRVPRDHWWQVWTEDAYPIELAELLERFPADFTTPDHKAPAGDRSAFRIGRHVDAWGCTFENVADGVHGEVKEPVIQSWSELDKIHPPMHLIDKGVEWVEQADDKDDYFSMLMFGQLFERMQFLRGTENLFMDMLEQPRELFELRDRVHEFNLKTIEAWCRTDLDALSFNDDWGTQKSLLIAPDLWRQIFKPMYREYAEAVHAAGKFIFMHSDGQILDIFGDLIEIGIDALNSQLFCMDIEQIGRRYKGKITFWGEIDRQWALPAEDPQVARDAVKRVCAALYDPRGGVIAQCPFGPSARPENVAAAYETWDQLTASE